jgi:lysophospholipase L1-like esterase
MSFGKLGTMGRGFGALGSLGRTGGAPLPASVATINAFGDSFTDGSGASDSAHMWRNIFGTALGATVTNSAAGGTVLQNSIFSGGNPQTGNGRDRYVSAMLGANLKEMATILYGFNDARYTSAPSTITAANYQNDLREIINGLVAGGYARNRIVLGGLPWITDTGLNTGTGGFSGQTRAGFEAFQTAAQAVAVETGVYWVDMYNYMRLNGGDSLIGVDDIHPNDAGHAVIAQGFLSARQRAISGSMTFLDDTFTDTDGVLITAHTPDSGLAYYSQPAFTASPHCSIAANRLAGTSASGVYQNYQTPRFGANYYVEAKLDFLSTISGDNVGVIARASPSAQTFYAARWGQSTSSFGLFKSVAGVLTQLGSNSVATFTSGSRVMRLTCQGSTISLSVDGVTLVSVTDTDITAQGFAGVRNLALQTTTTGIHIDRLTAANL